MSTSRKSQAINSNQRGRSPNKTSSVGESLRAIRRGAIGSFAIYCAFSTGIAQKSIDIFTKQARIAAKVNEQFQDKPKTTTPNQAHILAHQSPVVPAQVVEQIPATPVPAPFAPTQEQSIATNGDKLDSLLRAIAYHESKGNPVAHNPVNGGAYGKFQYIPSTWQESARRYYPPATRYATANQAPEPIQDAVTRLRYTAIFKSLNGDLFATAIANYMPAYADDAHRNPNDPDLNYAPPGNNGLTIRAFGQKVMGIMQRQEAENIPLRYNEAPDYEKYQALVNHN